MGLRSYVSGEGVEIKCFEVIRTMLEDIQNKFKHFTLFS